MTELSNLVLLNTSDVVARVLDLLTLLPALFHVVEPFLVPNLTVLQNLGLHSSLVAEQRLLLLLIESTLGLFVLLLTLNDAEEVVTLSLSLRGQLALFIAELL